MPKPILETWKAIPGYEGFYEVSDHGRVRSVPRIEVNAKGHSRPLRGRLLRQNVSRAGYLTIHLYKYGGDRHWFVHRLVAAAFIGPLPGGMMVCHNDGVGHHNWPENLRYDTHTANVADRERHGHQLRGDRVGTSKLKIADVLAIRALRGKKFQKDVAADFGISQTLVSVIQRGAAWRHIIMSEGNRSQWPPNFRCHAISNETVAR